jgi:hypothetical protein
MTRPGLGSRLTASLFPEDSAVGRDPAAWITETFGDELWSKQIEVAASVAANRVTCVPSGNGLGKTWLLARLALWWVMSAPIGESIAVFTAPVSRQIDSGIWAELRAAHTRGALPGVVTRNEWRIGDTLVALGRTASDYTDEARAQAAWQGLHRRRVFVGVDEASGVRPWLFRALPALMTGASARLLLTGNPLAPSGDFFEQCKPGSAANVIRVDALESPNFTDERVSPWLAEVLPSQAWLDEMRDEYGEGSPAWEARVRGRFPSQSDDGLISAEHVRDAQERDLEPLGPVVFGCDVARFGSDSTCVYRAQGGVARIVHHARGADLVTTTNKLVALVKGEPGSRAIVDETGLGGGVVDGARAANITVEGFNGAARPAHPDRFANLRAESAWRLREMLAEGEVDLDPLDDVLAGQMLAPRWFTNRKNLTQAESKSDMAKRGVASPDRFDALCMALFRHRGGAAMAVWVEDDDDDGAVDRSLSAMGSGGETGSLTDGLLDGKGDQW